MYAAHQYNRNDCMGMACECNDDTEHGHSGEVISLLLCRIVHNEHYSHFINTYISCTKEAKSD